MLAGDRLQVGTQRIGCPQIEVAQAGPIGGQGSPWIQASFIPISPHAQGGCRRDRPGLQGAEMMALGEESRQ